MPKHILIIILLNLFCIGQYCHAQQTKQFQSAFHHFTKTSGFQNSSIGFCLMNAENGKVLFSYNDSLSLVPASCLKIVTTGAALGILGEDHFFETKIMHTGQLGKDGIMHGNVIIIGGGDPTLGDDKFETKIDFQTFINVIKDAGIKSIDGKVLVVNSYFEPFPINKTWAWDDIGNYFGAGVYGFNYAENIYQIKLQPGAIQGSNVDLISTLPDNLNLHFDNRLKTGPLYSGDQSNIFVALNDSIRIIEGTIPVSKSPFTIKGSLPNPPAWFAKTLAELLYKDNLIKDKNQWEVISKLDTSIPIFNLKIFKSQPVSEIVHYANLNSINLYAECLLKEIGKIKYHSGTWTDGIKAIKKYWTEKGIDTLGLFMDDGSGLSRYDGITAQQLTKILASIKNEKYFDIFLNSLPVSGKSSSMKSMGKGTEMDGKIYSKTGHMDRARAYSGYFKSKSGKWMCFTLMVNNYSLSSPEIHDKIEKLLEAMLSVDY